MPSQVPGIDARDGAAPAGDLGNCDRSFELSEPHALRRDVPEAEVHMLDAGHVALDTEAEEIPTFVRPLIDRGR